MDYVLIRAVDSYFKNKHDIELSELSYSCLIEKLNSIFKIPGGDYQVPLTIQYENFDVKSQTDLEKAYEKTRLNGEYVLTLNIDYGFDPILSFAKTSDEFDTDFQLCLADKFRLNKSPSLLSDTSSFDVLTKQNVEFSCSFCHKIIVGIRYKCLNCSEDVNFCENCESKDNHNHPVSHVLAKIRNSKDWDNFEIIAAKQNIQEEKFNNCDNVSVSNQSDSETDFKLFQTGQHFSELMDRLFETPSLRWSILSQPNGTLESLDNALLKQTWKLSSIGGIQWPKKSLRVIPIKRLSSKDSTESNLAERFLDSIHCWSDVDRMDDGEMICITQIAINLPFLENYIYSNLICITINWHICTDGWPPRPLCTPMSTQLKLIRDFGKWLIQYDCCESSQQLDFDKDNTEKVENYQDEEEEEDQQRREDCTTPKLVQFVETQMSQKVEVAIPFELSFQDQSTQGSSTDEQTEATDEVSLTCANADFFPNSSVSVGSGVNPDWVLLPNSGIDNSGNKLLSNLMNLSPFSDSMFQLDVESKDHNNKEDVAVVATTNSSINEGNSKGNIIEHYYSHDEQLLRSRQHQRQYEPQQKRLDEQEEEKSHKENEICDDNKCTLRHHNKKNRNTTTTANSVTSCSSSTSTTATLIASSNHHHHHHRHVNGNDGKEEERQSQQQQQQFVLNQSSWSPGNKASNMYQYEATAPMDKLFKMGFYNRTLNQNLLNKYGNDLNKVINDLLLENE